MDGRGSFDGEQRTASTPSIYREKETQWSSFEGSGSVSSTDDEHSKLGNFFRKAKARGKRVVHWKKKKQKLIMVDQTFQTDVNLIGTVEQSASSPNIGFIASNDAEFKVPNSTVSQSQLQQSTTTLSQLPAEQPSEVVLDFQKTCQPVKPPLMRRISFLKFRFVFGLLLLVLTFLLPPLLVSFMWGSYVTVMVFMYLFVSKAIVQSRNEPNTETLQSIAREIDRQKALKQAIRYRGWMNELRRSYDPLTYSVNMTQSVMLELEGRTLRIVRPKRNVNKHTFFNDPTLRVSEPPMINCRTYDLSNADVKLRPHGLARRRWWNRKYPILIQLAPQKEVVVVDGDNDDDSDANYSQSDSENLNDNPISEERALRRRWTISKSTHDESFAKTNGDGLSRRGSTKSGARGKRIILFGRSTREKERWFHRLREACSVNRTTSGETYDVDKRRASNLSVPVIFDQSAICGAAGLHVSIEYYLYVSYGLQFAKMMAEIMKSSSVEHLPENGIIHMDLDLCQWTPKAADFKSEVVLAANAVVARLFFDFCRDERWIHAVSRRIEKKLATIDLPHFIETLTLAQLKLGTTTPQVIGVHSPVINDWGLWIDAEIKYEGGLELIIETKVDLVAMMEKKKNVVRKDTLSKLPSNDRRHYSDDELSFSAEYSANEDFGGNIADDEPSSGIGKKILTAIRRVAKSHFFHNVAELGPIKKIMEEISSTCLMLNVEVTLLEGTLAINIAPPPSDRLWFGFRRPPKLALKAVPQVGDRTVEMSTVSDWIENRLHVLLEKYLVVPNMADLVCPFMTGNELFKFGYTD
uniref:SMP-LTD domain-containing protein n=1 Tax=Plectus sambesii TaxID=2011161 RepID=A0A914XHZ2_9BILA